MTTGVSGQSQLKDGWKLLETRKKQLESAQAQTKAVQDAYTKIQGEQKDAQQLDAKLAQQIMVLSNFNVKEAPKEVKEPTAPTKPKEVAAPGNPPKEPVAKGTDDASKQTYATELNKYKSELAAYEKKDAEYKQYQKDLEQYDKDLKQYEKDKKEYDQYQKDLKEFSKYEALKKEIEAKAPDDVKQKLTDLMNAAQTKEDELKKAQGDEAELQREVDFSWDSYQQLQADLKDAKFDLTLANKGDTLTSVAKDKINATRQEGTAEADVKSVYDGIVAGDKANGNKSDDKYYRSMAIGSTHSYTAEQIGKMGADVDLSDDFGADFGTEMNALLDNAPEAKPDKPQEDTSAVTHDAPQDGKDSKVTLPRGVDIRVGTNDGTGKDSETNGKKADSLADYGLIEKDGKYYRAKKGEDGTLVPRDDKAFTAEEVNEWFRSIEDSSGSNYSKYLDKAEELGIDYTQYSSAKDLKAAVKTEEKRQKAIDKYSDEIKQYNIQTEGRTVDQIKADVKTAKEKAKTSGVTSATTSLSASSSTSAESKTNTNSSETVKSDVKTKLQAEKEKQLSNLSENERKKYNEIMTDTDLFTGGQIWADNYLTHLSNYTEGAKYDIQTKSGLSGKFTVRLTNDGEKVLEQNGIFYEIGKDGYPDKSKLVKKEDIKPFS